ncbi:MAG: recombinase family protein [Gordonia sp. (in: high G+C Gram-positive bacteria)]|uniref:recombinase family protein n=1 Tax=Gordonia sp. (in: high G+C Gram-positive bacteria) TaxID=84139 RepID=UPI0039E2F085
MNASKPLVAREYLRVSKDAGKKGKSPAQQHDENLESFEQQGWVAHHAEPYADPDISASKFTTKKRTGFDQLIADLESNAFDADILAMWEASRGSRRVSEWLSLLELCADRGVRIWVTANQSLYDPNVPAHRKTLLDQAVDAEYESAKISMRIKRDVRDAAKAGRVHGKNLYGYKRIYKQTPDGSKLDKIVEHPEQAPIVRDAADRVMKGESFYAIAKDFNERGIPPRRPSHAKDGRRKNIGWTGGAVKQMLSMPAYAAKRQHHGEIVADAQWPPLIDYDEWLKLQAMLFRPERRRNPNMWTVKHLCTGVAFCGVERCGARLRVGKQNKGSMPKVPGLGEATTAEIHAAKKVRDAALAKRREECICSEGPDEDGVPGADRCPWHYRTYTCSGLPGVDGKRGFHVAMKVEYLDEIVTALVIARLARPDFLAMLGQQDGEVDAQRQELLDAIAKNQAYLEQVREQAAADRDLTIYRDQRDRIEPLIKAANDKLARLADADPLVLSIAATGDAEVDQEAREAAIEAVWNRLDIVEKRRVIAAIMEPHVKPAARRGSRTKDLDRVVPGYR